MIDSRSCLWGWTNWVAKAGRVPGTQSAGFRCASNRSFPATRPVHRERLQISDGAVLPAGAIGARALRFSTILIRPGPDLIEIGGSRSIDTDKILQGRKTGDNDMRLGHLRQSNTCDQSEPWFVLPDSMLANLPGHVSVEENPHLRMCC